MQDKIDDAIYKLAERAIDKGNQDDLMKITQSIANLTHSKINLIEYDKIKKSTQ